MASQAEIAKHLDLSQQAVSKLLLSGVLVPRKLGETLSIVDCRVAYIRHLREVAAGRCAGDPDAPNLVLERGRLARAQAVAAERKNLHADGDLIEMERAESPFFEAARTSRDAWLNSPSRVSPLLAAKLGVASETLFGELTEHVHKQLSDLSDPDLTTAMLERA